MREYQLIRTVSLKKVSRLVLHLTNRWLTFQWNHHSLLDIFNEGLSTQHTCTRYKKRQLFPFLSFFFLLFVFMKKMDLFRSTIWEIFYEKDLRSWLYITSLESPLIIFKRSTFRTSSVIDEKNSILIFYFS